MSKMSLAAARVNAGFTQREVVEKTSIRANALLDMEKGRRYPTAEQLAELCNLYGCESSDINCKVFILADA